MFDPLLLGRVRAALIGALVLSAVLCLRPDLGLGATLEDAAHEAAQSVLSNDAYQRDLPFPKDGTSETLPQFDPPSLRLPDGVGTLAKVLLWTILAAVAVVVLVWLVRELPDQLRRRDEESDSESAPAAAKGKERALAATLEEADRLAEQGAHAEAMHVLLLYTLDVMRRQLGIDFRQSQTSREILARQDISLSSRTPLSMIVSAVELTYFGGRDAGAEDYRNCRRNFERFAAAGSDIP